MSNIKLFSIFLFVVLTFSIILETNNPSHYFGQKQHSQLTKIAEFLHTICIKRAMHRLGSELNGKTSNGNFASKWNATFPGNV